MLRSIYLLFLFVFFNTAKSWLTICAFEESYYFLKFFIKNFTNPYIKHFDPADCPTNFESYSKQIEKLKLVAYLNPKVTENVTIIRDTFPCEEGVRKAVERFVSYFGSLLKRKNGFIRFLFNSHSHGTV